MKEGVACKKQSCHSYDMCIFFSTRLIQRGKENGGFQHLFFYGWVACKAQAISSRALSKVHAF